MASNKLKYTLNTGLFSYIKKNFPVDDKLATKLSADIHPSSLCKGKYNLITPYDRHINIPYLLAFKLRIPFKLDKNNKVVKPCKLCERVVSELQMRSSYLYRYLSQK